MVTRWRSDPWARGSYSFVSTSASGNDYDILACPVTSSGEQSTSSLDSSSPPPRLFFAGNFSCIRHQLNYIHVLKSFRWAYHTELSCHGSWSFAEWCSRGCQDCRFLSWLLILVCWTANFLTNLSISLGKTCIAYYVVPQIYITDFKCDNCRCRFLLVSKSQFCWVS